MWSSIKEVERKHVSSSFTFLTLPLSPQTRSSHSHIALHLPLLCCLESECMYELWTLNKHFTITQSCSSLLVHGMAAILVALRTRIEVVENTTLLITCYVPESQMTPTSAECPQLWDPILLWLQCSNRSSRPLHITLSRNIARLPPPNSGRASGSRKEQLHSQLNCLHMAKCFRTITIHRNGNWSQRCSDWIGSAVITHC